MAIGYMELIISSYLQWLQEKGVLIPVFISEEIEAQEG